MTLPPASSIRYGGDYNPEQWPTETWDDDYAAFNAAHMNTLTVGVFMWSLIQPDETTYDFDVLDAIIDRAHAEDRQVVLATATAAVPPWLATTYPDVNRVDFEGRHHNYGQRHNACHSSPNYRRLATELAGRIAQRYAHHPAVIAWHINNEYGGYGGACYCDNCAQEFRTWLTRRYGTLDALNDAWYTTFWSHRYTNWDQIVPPTILSEHWKSPNHTAFQGITLDYYRFTTDTMIRTFTEEKDAIRAHSDLPVTTNFMGLYKPLDYHRWAPHLDFASWDNYPPDEHSANRMALAHDTMRGLKNGQPFWVMEQTPSTTASRDVNPVKKPGILGLWSWQSVAHGADAVLYFQMRQNRGACEKYHGAVLNHSGRLDTRVFTEAATLGHDFDTLGEHTQGLRTPARAAVILDWDSWWALEMSDGPNRHLSYIDTVLRLYTPLWEAGVPLDVIPITAPLDTYDVVVAPALHMLTTDITQRLTDVAHRGGTVITTVMSGRVDTNDHAFLDITPGPLAPLFGIRIDETDAHHPNDPVTLTTDLTNPLTPHRTNTPTHGTGHLVYDIIQLDGAEPVATYTGDWFTGTPAATRHSVGAGDAWYIGTILDDTTMTTIMHNAIARHHITSPFAATPGLEHTRRGHIDFLLNHHHTPHTLTLPFHGTNLLTGHTLTEGDTITLNPTDVAVIARHRDHTPEDTN